MDSGGVSIDAITPTSPLAAAGLAVGDLVRSVNGASINGLADLRKAIATLQPEEPAMIGVVRKRAETKVSLPPGLNLQPLR